MRCQSISHMKQKRYHAISIYQKMLILVLITTMCTACNENSTDKSISEEDLNSAALSDAQVPNTPIIVDSSDSTDSADSRDSTDSTESKDVTVDVIEPDAERIVPKYKGAFLLPADEEWNWSGEALAYNPNGADQQGSLFASGHNHRIAVSEISIPTPVISSRLSDLPAAETLQPFTTIYGYLYDDWNLEIPRVDLEVINDTLYLCRGEHNQDEGNPNTHCYTSLNLTEQEPKGVWQIGDDTNNYATNDYLFKVPSDWANEYALGYDLATGRFRDGGWGGMGPSLLILKTGDMVEDNLRINPVELIRYTSSDNWDNEVKYKVNGYCEADSWTGGAWIESDELSAVVFCGTHGFGKHTWYGYANGIEFPIDGEGPFPEVPPYPYDERGWWNDDLRPVIMFYDPSDLGSVMEGKMMPYEVQPYAIIDISEYMFNPIEDTKMRYIGAMTYNPSKNWLYIQELLADGDKPIIHVFETGYLSETNDSTLVDIEETTETQASIKNLIFIHHSCGENWLSDGEGGGFLTKVLNDNNYSVADIYYGWNDSVSFGVTGDMTDTQDWPLWFNDSVMHYVYNESQAMTAPNVLDRSTGENEIIMFKSCFPNSDVGSSIEDEQEIYDELLEYFKTREDKMFVLITPPPMQDISNPEKTRELCSWLTNRNDGWLSDYKVRNVYVFDLYNVLTHPSNHHMILNEEEVHIIGEPSENELFYDSNGDDHPNAIGNLKATEEFVPLLNKWYQEWE